GTNVAFPVSRLRVERAFPAKESKGFHRRPHPSLVPRNSQMACDRTWEGLASIAKLRQTPPPRVRRGYLDTGPLLRYRGCHPIHSSEHLFHRSCRAFQAAPLSRCRPKLFHCDPPESKR